MRTDTLPLGAACYFRSDIFSAVPHGQRRDHALRWDVWSRIRVLDGALRVITLAPARDDVLLRSGDLFDVQPGVCHHLESAGPGVNFVVHLYRVFPDTTRGDIARWENEGGRVQR